jgi:hypothetical protein
VGCGFDPAGGGGELSWVTLRARWVTSAGSMRAHTAAMWRAVLQQQHSRGAWAALRAGDVCSCGAVGECRAPRGWIGGCAAAGAARAGLHTSTTRAAAQPLSGDGGLEPPPQWAQAVCPYDVVPEYDVESADDWRTTIGPPLDTVRQRRSHQV